MSFTMADLGIRIPCGKKAEKIGAQGHKSVGFSYQKRVADHGHHCQIVQEEVGPEQSCFSEIQL